MARWKTEAEMCAAMVPAYREAGFTVYPETSGWDQLLVGADGFQVGIQAKLRANVEVLDQAAEGWEWPGGYPRGPDVRAVLVPEASNSFRRLARLLRVAVLHAGESPGSLRLAVECADRTETKQRCWLPPFVPAVPAGVPSPRQVTKWRVRAIALCERLRANGYVTRRDFKEMKLSLQIWLQPRAGKPAWLVQERGTRPARFIARPGVNLPDVGYVEPPSSR